MIDGKNLLRVNGVRLSPSPTGVQVDFMDITKAERNSQGTMLIDFIAEKTKVYLTWDLLYSGDMQQLLQAFNNHTFTLEYPNPKTNNMASGSFYRGDRVVPMGVVFDSGKAIWQGFSINLIER